ncbi:MAG: hypothetical protein IMZ69_00625 [Spirochaetes bacterium]|nr:hypothetical protein [Spirochaetota bacterium]
MDERVNLECRGAKLVLLLHHEDDQPAMETLKMSCDCDAWAESFFCEHVLDVLNSECGSIAAGKAAAIGRAVQAISHTNPNIISETLALARGENPDRGNVTLNDFKSAMVHIGKLMRAAGIWMSGR